MNFDWKAVVLVCFVAVGFLAALYGAIRWADAVDFQQANTNAGEG